MTGTQETLSASNLFWTGNNGLLVIAALHFIRESCVPGRFQRRLLVFYKNDADSDIPQKRSTQHSGEKILVYDSGRRHDNQTGLPVLDQAKGDESMHTDDIAFEDDHVIIFHKKTGSPQPRTVSALRWEEPKYSGSPFTDSTLGQFIMAAFWQCFQIYVFYRAMAESIVQIQQSSNCKLVVATGFILPSTSMVLSLAINFDSVRTAMRYPDTLSSDAHGWVLNIMQPLALLSIVMVPVMWCKVALA